MLAVVVVFLFFGNVHHRNIIKSRWKVFWLFHHLATASGRTFTSQHIQTHGKLTHSVKRGGWGGGVGRLSCVAIFLLPLEGGFFLFSFSSLLFSFSFTKHYTKIRHDLFSSSLLIRIFGLLFSLSTAGAGNIYFATYVRRKLERRERGCVCVYQARESVCKQRNSKEEGKGLGGGRGIWKEFFSPPSLFWYKQTKINNKSYCMIMREMNGRDEYYYNYNKSTTSNAWTTQHNKH